VNFSGEILAMTVVGGMRHFISPAVGAAFFVFFRDFLSAYTENWLVFFGALFMVFILLSREGISGLAERLMALLGAGDGGSIPPSRRARRPARGRPSWRQSRPIPQDATRSKPGVRSSPAAGSRSGSAPCGPWTVLT
jgi:branched-chain amino acid transport system ATP-binding protein